MTRSLSSLLAELASEKPAFADALMVGVLPQGILGFATDVDGVMNDLEPAQELTWVSGSGRLLRFAFDRDVPKELIALIKNHFRQVFASGDFESLVSGLYKLLGEFGFIPSFVSSVQDLDDQLTLYRAQELLDYAKAHRATVFAPEHEVHLAAMEHLSTQGCRLGLYTNTPKIIAKPLLYLGYGKERMKKSFDSVGRLYGSDIVRLKLRRKKHADGWLELARRWGLEPRQMLIADDRPNVCLHAQMAGFNVICITGRTTARIRETMEELNGARKDIWAVPDLAEVVANLRPSMN